MSVSRLTSTLLSAAIALSCTLPMGAQGASPEAQYLSDGRRFAVDLYQRLAKTQGNLFFSPWSIRSALGMAYAGARTQTEAGMMRALHDSVGQPRYHAENSQLDATLRAEGGRYGELLAANAVWTARDLDLESAFVDTLKDRYSASPRPIDFKDGEMARQTINTLVEEQTRGRIHNLIPTALNPATRLVLTNAVYFRNAWQEAFDIHATSDAPFHRHGGKVVRAPFMHMDREFRLCEAPDVQVLELPFHGGNTSMLIVLPRDRGGLDALERFLNPDSLTSWASLLRPAFVRVAVPKFRIEMSHELAAVLGAMGMGEALTPKADFSGVSRERPLFLSRVFHKAYVQMDEVGTEAAAATSLELKKSVGIRSTPMPVLFIADHPFLFLIRSRPTGVILFMGRMADPS